MRGVARKDQRHLEGAPGDWFIDTRCIGCGASAAIAPDLIVLDRAGRRFVFDHQPGDAEEVRLAQLAAEVCPTLSIGTESGLRWTPHHPLEVAEGVWRCGSNSPDAIGANSYLVERAAGNLLVDAPRFSPRLVRWMVSLGGVDQVLLTHADDVGEAERYVAELDATAVVHEADSYAAPFATRVLTGTEPQAMAPGVLAIPTPGHTAGHVMYLVDDGTLFTGDSLDWDTDLDDLWAEEAVCWYSWPEQLASLERLADHDFVRVVPGHGTLSPTLPAAEMHTRLLALVARLRDAAADA